MITRLTVTLNGQMDHFAENVINRQMIPPDRIDYFPKIIIHSITVVLRTDYAKIHVVDSVYTKNKFIFGSGYRRVYFWIWV